MKIKELLEKLQEIDKDVEDLKNGIYNVEETEETAKAEKAMDMVKHLVATFNLPVSIGSKAAQWIKPNEYCIIRTYSAGVFAGYVEQLDGQNAVLRDTRRIWKWDGACSLSQLAVDGTSKPNECKFAVPVAKTIVTEVIEIIPCTAKAKASIEGVEEWKR